MNKKIECVLLSNNKNYIKCSSESLKNLCEQLNNKSFTTVDFSHGKDYCFLSNFKYKDEKLICEFEKELKNEQKNINW